MRSLLLLALLLAPLGCRTTAPSSDDEAVLTRDAPLTVATERDQDRDGIPDSEDRCPLDAEDLDGLADEDGCPEEDADADGLADAQDLCPTTAETINGFEDADGCPDQDRVLCNDCQAIKRLVSVIDFPEGLVALRPDQDAELEDLARKILDSDPPVQVYVVGHSSDRGEVLDQESVARDRAWHVHDVLVMFGVPEERIATSHQGARHPRVPHRSKGARLLNDRVEILVR